MEKYTIIFTEKAQKELRELSKEIVTRILDKLEEKLLEDPYKG